MPGPTILLSAGEPSGDLHGARLARELRRTWPEARLFGLGGPRMAAEGVELLERLDRLAVMGFVEVLARLPFFLRLSARLRDVLRSRRPDLVIPINYPGLNLRLARDAHRLGIPVLFYVAPQVWAWRRGRIRQLAEHADRLAVVLPFEEEIFRAAEARVTYVGHPLVDQLPDPPAREGFCGGLGLDPARPILALFPGSRVQEVRRHASLFLETFERLRSEHPDLQAVVATSGDVPARDYGALDVASTQDSWAALYHARAALVKSGTSTLQAALTGTPLVIAYRANRLTFSLARRLVTVDHVGLVNLVAGARVAPELLQHEATPTALADALSPLLLDSIQRARAIERLRQVADTLSPRAGEGRGVAARVAELAADLLGASGHESA